MSRILGYTRDILIASSLGASLMADAFFVAFRLPNFFRTLSAEGAFNAAFVPLFSSKLAADGQKKAVDFAEHVFSFMFAVLLILTILMQIFMPAIIHILAPGFTDNPEKFDTTVALARITFPYLVFISIVSLFSGILNSMGKFAAAASAPIWLNAVMILFLLFLSEFTGTPAHALSYGVMVAGIVQMLWLMVAAANNGIKLRLRKPEIDKDVKTLLKRMVPGILGGGVTQINLWVNTVIATTMASAVSYLYYADRLVQFPLAIVGTAMGTALLPMLSRHMKKSETDQAIFAQNRALEIVMLFTIPSAIAFMVIAEPLISVMFERGKFGPEETAATSAALIAYAFGLPAFVMIKIFAPVFFSTGDTKTPVKIAVICLIANVTVSLILIRYIDYVGLAVSTSFTAWLNCSLLCCLLTKRGLYKIDQKLRTRLPRVILSSIIMGLALFYLKPLLAVYFAGSSFYKIMALLGLIFSGMLTFFIVAYTSGAFRFSDLRLSLSR